MENNRKPPVEGKPYPPFSAGLVGPVEKDLYAAMRTAEDAKTDAESAQEAAEIAQGKAEDAQEAAEAAESDAEAYAVGTRGGEDVDSDDPAYHNNAKYYADEAEDSATAAATSAATFVTDKTLTVGEKAADAKTVGYTFDRISVFSTSDNLISVTDFTDKVGTSTVVDSENSKITVTSTNTGSYNSVQTKPSVTDMQAILTPGKRYRLSAHAEAVSGSPKIRVAMRGVQGNESGVVPGTAIYFTEDNITDGYSEFIADQYIKKVALFVAYGSSTKNSVSEFSNIELREITATAVDTQARSDVQNTGNDLSILRDEILDVGLISGWTAGKAITSNVEQVDPTSPTTSADYRFVLIECEEGDVFTVSLTSGNQFRGWNFLDSEYNVLTQASGALTDVCDLAITAPPQAAYLLINTKANSDGHFHACYHGSPFRDIRPGLDAVEAQVNGMGALFGEMQLYELNKGFYIDLHDDTTDYSLTPSSRLSYAVIDCVPNDEFTLYGKGGDWGRLYGFVDGEGNILEKTSKNASASNLVIKAPSDTEKLVVNIYPNGGKMFVCKGAVAKQKQEKALRPKGMLSVAHQGYWNDNSAPKNSIYAYELACLRGAFAVNTAQVRQSADGTLWIMHNEDVGDTTDGEGLIGTLHDDELEELLVDQPEGGAFTNEQRKIPKLFDVLRMCVQYGTVPMIRAAQSGSGALPSTYGDAWQSIFDEIEKLGLRDSVMFSGSRAQLKMLDKYFPAAPKILFWENSTTIPEMLVHLNAVTWESNATVYGMVGPSQLNDTDVLALRQAGYGLFSWASDATQDTCAYYGCDFVNVEKDPGLVPGVFYPTPQQIAYLLLN